MGPPDAPPGPGHPHAQSRGLFRRLYLAFVLTTIIAVTAAGIGAWWLARAMGNEWATETLERLGDMHDALVEVIDDEARLQDELAAVEAQTRTELSVYTPGGRKLAGPGPDRIERRNPSRALRRGQPVVHRRPQELTPLVLFPLQRDDRLIAVVHVRPRDRPWLWPLLLSGTTILGCLAIGAALVARPLGRRLEALRTGADRIAQGELSHRVALPVTRRQDELDELGTAFNHMAERVEQLVTGQRMLLANVSHELRTPLARIRVLLELLQEHGEALAPSSEPSTATRLERIRKGLHEMAEDTAEIETLVADLLTSGRLELGPTIERRPVQLDALLQRVAARFSAECDAARDVIVGGDALLLERLFSNLLSNARRVCPSGKLRATLRVRSDAVEVAIEDEGPGIPPEFREAVFEPFRRLDHGRTRDRGGVGLGLYLCRQVARAHGGTIEAMDREDGRSGVRMVVTLPR